VLRQIARRAIVSLSGAALAVAGGLIPAQASGPPGWRVVQTLGPMTGVTYPAGLVASSARDAWSLWSSCSPCASPSVPSYAVEHWNGRTWKYLAIPRALSGYAAASVALAAGSANDAWLLDGFPRGGKALFWNGRLWSLRTIPQWVTNGAMSFGGLGTGVAVAPASPGRDAIWVFSTGVTGGRHRAPFAARYDGHRWAKVRLPMIAEQVSTVRVNDIWALGPPAPGTSGAAAVLGHWDGRSWRTLAVPPAVRVPAHSMEYTGNLVATGPRDAWLQRNIERGTSGARTLYLLHWNGRRWQRVTLHYPTSDINYSAQDGHGGIWLVANGTAPRYRWYLDHLNNGGRWSRQAVPAAAGTTLQQLDEITWIPGTQSLWAAGGMLPARNRDAVLGAILKYGS